MSTEYMRPRVTMVIIIDQLAQHYITKLRPHLTGGIKQLLDQGQYYTNVRHPHAMPATATGHTCLSTGTLAKDHGIIGNYWYNQAGTKIEADDDVQGSNHNQFARDGSLRSQHKSGNNIMVDGISDNFMLYPPTGSGNRSVYSLSIKSRAAVGLGNKKGVSIWFDTDEGYFTTSKAFTKQLPSWVKDINDQYCSSQLKDYLWQTQFELDSPAYAFPDIFNYAYSGYGRSIIANNQAQYQELPTRIGYDKDGQNYKRFLRTPAAGELLVQLAKRCIDQALTQNNDELLLWVSFSNLDKIAHIYGPDALEAIDTVYHLDQQVGTLINYIAQKVAPHELLIALSSDHGSMPIPEILSARGYPAMRVNTTRLITKLNKIITHKFGVDDIVLAFKTPQFFLNETKLATLKVGQKNKIVRFITSLLNAHPGIKQCWTGGQLRYLRPHSNTLEANFANQYYPTRSGRITCQTHPYCQFTRWETGTGHRTCYHYDTHVPVVLYRPGSLENKVISDPALTTQFAPSLAQLLDIPKPSACMSTPLPKQSVPE